MKKLVIVIAVLCCLGARLAAEVHVTSCGIKFTSVDVEAFDSEEEYNEWLAEMDEILCGKE